MDTKNSRIAEGRRSVLAAMREATDRACEVMPYVHGVINSLRALYSVEDWYSDEGMYEANTAMRNIISLQRSRGFRHSFATEGPEFKVQLSYLWLLVEDRCGDFQFEEAISQLLRDATQWIDEDRRKASGLMYEWHEAQKQIKEEVARNDGLYGVASYSEESDEVVYEMFELAGDDQVAEYGYVS